MTARPRRQSRSSLHLLSLIILVTFVEHGAPSPAAEAHLDGRTFKLPDGFTIEKVAGPPMVDRPIVADFDEQGRLYVADSSGYSENGPKQLAAKPHRVVRLNAADPSGIFRTPITFADHLSFPEGAMWYAGSLYVGAPPSIWKLTDSTGAGVVDQRVEWFAGKTLTNCANDIHGPYLGPDGWIYWCKGAFAEQTYARPGHPPLVTKAAHIFRCRPDGSGIEPVMTGGMDNPIDVVFSPGGERFFTTTFLQNPAGGHRDGIIHAVYGGLYGKVHDDVLDDHPHTSPDLMPVLSHLGPAACCGLARYESDAFGPDYQNNLFAACFNLHKITRHILSSDGATFSSRDEDFVVCDSVDFHPTDVIEDADGSLLILDTGGWYKICCPTSQFARPDVLGAIYRVRKIDAPPIEDPRGLKIAWNTLGATELGGLLSDARPAVQKRAIAALAAQKSAAIPVIKSLLDHGNFRGRLSAVWAGTQIESPDARKVVRAALADPDSIVRQAAAHSASVWRDKGALAALQTLLSSSSPQNRRVAAEALGRLGDARAVPALLAQIATNNDHVLDHSLTYALIEIADIPATTVGLSNASPRVRRSAMIALDQMENGKLDPQAVIGALNDADTALREAAAWIASRHPEWGDQLGRALRQRIAANDLNPESRAQVQHQLARLAKSQAIQSFLADCLSDAKLPAAQRRLVLAAMAESSIKPPPAAWVDAISKILSGDDAALLADAVGALRRMSLDKKQTAAIEPQLLQVAGRDDLSASVRLDALAAGPSGSLNLTPALFSFLATQLAPTQPTMQRIAASQAIGRAKLSSEQLTTLTESVQAAGPLEIDHLLNGFSQSQDANVGHKLVAALQQSKALTALRADALKARLAKFGPEVQQEAEPLLARLNPDAAQQRAKLDELATSLATGDIRRGQQIFNGTKVACATCHAIGYVGGTVGPDLTRIGQIRTERDLLESIIFPSASFVQSYEPMLVDTRDGDRQSGIIRKNDADEVVLVTGPNQELHIPRANIKDIRPGTVSVMPSGLEQQLSKQELADLVAFLKACK
ncbi:MAG TPA: PVC-type heme-binding CxxCH protein [Humisphaera sp.]|nr:PVC-type heme-binding CxxCH protein [Humisphaera sp.]